MATVGVSRRGIESIRRGHPWIYRSAVVQHSTSRSGPPRGQSDEASIVSIVDESGHPLGCGVWDPVSPIAVRVWSLDPRARLDSAMFRARLEGAIEVRARLFADGKTTAYRLLNGEGDRVPAFVVDRYGDVAVLRIDGDAARAVSAELLRDVEAPLRAIGVTTLLERTGRRGEAPEVRARFGPPRDKVEVAEHGVPFVVDVARGQKTGAFLDQRENRRRVGELVARRARRSSAPVRVLNLFSYAGGFSLRAALAGGTVTSVDVAMAAHATAQESFRLAGVDPRAHTFVTADCFAWLEAAAGRGDRWDVVISDPPSFAPSEKAKPKGIAAYRSLHRACARVLAPGGTFVAASCSSHVSAEDFAGTLDDAALDRADLRLLEQFGPPADHPTLPAFPEGRYLKLCLLE
ncbi:MAG: class I SAM-dependent rRNA methyltransferase [Labilithrix sp.]|nr:class I SAM-dependent rRNA methyltransferase [Labilithrix sp.]